MYFCVYLISMSIVIVCRIPQLHYGNIFSHLWRLFLNLEFRLLVLEWNSCVNGTSVLDVVF